jgi:hypothetical protein
MSYGNFMCFNFMKFLSLITIFMSLVGNTTFASHRHDTCSDTLNEICLEQDQDSSHKTIDFDQSKDFKDNNASEHSHVCLNAHLNLVIDFGHNINSLPLLISQSSKANFYYIDSDLLNFSFIFIRPPIS